MTAIAALLLLVPGLTRAEPGAKAEPKPFISFYRNKSSGVTILRTNWGTSLSLLRRSRDNQTGIDEWSISAFVKPGPGQDDITLSLTGMLSLDPNRYPESDFNIILEADGDASGYTTTGHRVTKVSQPGWEEVRRHFQIPRSKIKALSKAKAANLYLTGVNFYFNDAQRALMARFMRRLESVEKR